MVQEMVRSVSVRRHSTVEEHWRGIQVDEVVSNDVASNIDLSNVHEDPTESEVRSEIGETKYTASTCVTLNLTCWRKLR